VFGGREHSGLLSPNAIHVYNVLGARWLKTIPQGFAPSARCGHVAATLGLNRLLVTGGVSERGPESDSALLTLARSDTWDPQEGMWRAHEPELTWRSLFAPKGAELPAGRAYAAAAACGGRVWVHGGSLEETVVCRRAETRTRTHTHEHTHTLPSAPRTPRSPRSPGRPPASPRGRAGCVLVPSHPVRSLLAFELNPQGWAAAGLTDELLVAESSESTII